MKNQDTIGRALLAMFAFAVLANCAKADIESAQEHQGTGRVVIHDPEAEMGHGNPLFKWMIVSPDGSKGFANDFTTNAISVITEDGTNYYAHVQGENNDRTKVIHFTVDKNGIPNSHGDVIDTTLSSEEDNQEKMKDRTLVGVKNGYLYFYATGKEYYSQDEDMTSPTSYHTSLIYNPVTTNTYLDESVSQKCLSLYQDNSTLYFLKGIIDAPGHVSCPKIEYVNDNSSSPVPTETYLAASYMDGYNTMTVLPSGEYYLGSLREGVVGRKNVFFVISEAQLPGPISGLSNNGEEVFATTESTNAFYNVTLNDYNVVKDENGQPKPMIPPTTNGLLRVIDNRKKGGKFLYVTRKGILSIEE